MMRTSNNKLGQYQFYSVATILEHVIECFHTIVTDETNPYHPPISWLTRKQMKPPKDEIFHDLIKECSKPVALSSYVQHEGTPQQQSIINHAATTNNYTPSRICHKGVEDAEFSSSIRSRIEKCSSELKRSIVSKTKDGCAPLFIACKLGHFKKAKYLLETCLADIEQKGRYEAIEDHNVHSVSPLWVAAVSGHYSIVKLLIDLGANINSLSDTGSTPLRSACFLCRDDENQLPTGSIEGGMPDLSQITTANKNPHQLDRYYKIVELLVENGADILKPNHNGGTCLINSIHNYRLTEYIINHGVDVNASDYQFKTALHYAIQQGRLEVTKLLIRHGADPMLRSNLCDDALQLSCLGGHLEIFKFLLKAVKYPPDRIVDAYKLMGSSILELNYDLTQVRNLWLTAIRLQAPEEINYNNFNCQQENGNNLVIDNTICDKRRSLAFGDSVEFRNEQELRSLTADDFRIQSLLISERILSQEHRETMQRLLYRGTFYISSLRPDRCIDLWIYALILRLRNDSILHFESIFSAQAITKLFLDLFSKGQEVKFQEVYDVLSLLIGELENCKRQLKLRPIFCLHTEIFDLLLGIIVNLLFTFNCAISNSQPVEGGVGRDDKNLDRLKSNLLKKLISIDPRSSNGSSLLHICITPGIFDSDTIKLMSSIVTDRGEKGALPILELIDLLLDNGLQVDSANQDGLSALQVLCLNSTRISDRTAILKHLVERGAHLDRHLPSSEHVELMRQALKSAGVNLMHHVKLTCLAARKVAESKIKFDASALTSDLKNLIAIH